MMLDLNKIKVGTMVSSITIIPGEGVSVCGDGQICSVNEKLKIAEVAGAWEDDLGTSNMIKAVRFADLSPRNIAQLRCNCVKKVGELKEELKMAEERLERLKENGNE